MPIPNQTIFLEKFNSNCKTIIAEAQDIADTMRHSTVTLLHIRASAESFVVANETLVKLGIAKPAFHPEVVKDFKEVLEKEARLGASTATLLSHLPKDAPGPKTAYISRELLAFIDFLGDSAAPDKVNLYLLVSQLADTMKES